MIKIPLWAFVQVRAYKRYFEIFIPKIDTPICDTFPSMADACAGVQNSVCVDTGVNSRTCQCAPGYYGATTAIDIPDSSDATGFFTGTCTGTLTRPGGTTHPPQIKTFVRCLAVRPVAMY